MHAKYLIKAEILFINVDGKLGFLKGIISALHCHCHYMI